MMSASIAVRTTSGRKPFDVKAALICERPAKAKA